MSTCKLVNKEQQPFSHLLATEFLHHSASADNRQCSGAATHQGQALSVLLRDNGKAKAIDLFPCLPCGLRSHWQHTGSAS